MDKSKAEYVTRDFSAVDKHVDELARRERILTWRLFVDNLKRSGIPLILIACALAILLIALGIFIWLIKKEKIIEVDKIVRQEIIKEVPVLEIEQVVKEVPVDRIVEVPKYFPVYTFNSDPIIMEKIRTILLEGGGDITEQKLQQIERILNSQTSENVDNQDNVGQPEITSGENISEPSSKQVDTENKIARQRLTKNNVRVEGKSLSFLLKWENKNDLDLYVMRPDRKTIGVNAPFLAGKFGGKLDVDKNYLRGITNEPIENINFQEAMSGEYKIAVRLFKDRTNNTNGYTNFKILVYEDGKLARAHSDRISHKSLRNQSIFFLRHNYVSK